MKVVEIFNSIEGEGLRAGLPCTFIRLYGCNLSCSYCDTRYACENNEYMVMSVEEIVNCVKQWTCDRITITGGEPLIHPGIEQLITELCNRRYEVNIETNGSVPRPYLGVPKCSRPMYTVDYKSISSGMSDKMCPEAFKGLNCLDTVKFVVGSQEDLQQALEVVEKYNFHCKIYVSPVFGKIEPADIVSFIQQHCLWNWRVQIQLHKVIWPADMRGV